jgi:hypothetical protein
MLFSMGKVVPLHKEDISTVEPSREIQIHIGGSMHELVSLIVKKTRIPEATAKTIVSIVIDFLKDKLPAPVGAQIDALLSSNAKGQPTLGAIGAGGGNAPVFAAGGKRSVIAAGGLNEKVVAPGEPVDEVIAAGGYNVKGKKKK